MFLANMYFLPGDCVGEEESGHQYIYAMYTYIMYTYTYYVPSTFSQATGLEKMKEVTTSWLEAERGGYGACSEV